MSCSTPTGVCHHRNCVESLPEDWAERLTDGGINSSDLAVLWDGPALLACETPSEAVEARLLVDGEAMVFGWMIFVPRQQLYRGQFDAMSRLPRITNLIWLESSDRTAVKRVIEVLECP